MKSALVFYLYGTKNAGDMAICIGAVELLRQKGYRITMVSRFSESESEYQVSKDYMQQYDPDVVIAPGPFSFERDFTFFKKLKAYAGACMKMVGIIEDRKIRQLIDNHDVVFFNGGNLLRGENATDYMRLAALFYPIEIAKKKGKPVYCLPQSTAKLSILGEKLLRRYLQGMKKVFVRERASYEQLSSMFPQIPFVLSTDLAFFCSDHEGARQKCNEMYGNLPSGKRTAVVLRGTGIGDIGNLDSDLMDKMLDIMENYMMNHSSDHYFIIVQTLKDREISERFFERTREHAYVELLENHDPRILRELYRQMDLTVTMRLHAAILSLSARTPVAGIFSEKWGLKNSGILEDYSMPYIMIEKDDVQNLNQRISSIPPDVSAKIDQTILLRKEAITFEED